MLYLTLLSMGIAQRRERERNSLRQDIMDAATTMFAEEGFERVSMRKLADRVEYSPTAIYLHFRDKDALFQAVCEAAFKQLVVRLDKQRRKFAGDPLANLRAGLKAYIEFGLKHPDQYMVAFMSRAHGAQVPFEASAGAEAFGYLQRAVTECIEAKIFRSVHPELTAQVLWMSVHGLVSLLIAKAGFPFAPKAALIEAQLDLLLDGLAR